MDLTHVDEQKSLNDKILEFIDSKSIDIDLAFYKYGILYKHNINNYYKDEDQARKNKIKTYILSVWLVFNIIRHSLYLYYSKNGRVPIYFFDILQDYGGITVYYYMAAILGTILSFRIIILFNKKNKYLFGWFEILRRFGITLSYLFWGSDFK